MGGRKVAALVGSFLVPYGVKSQPRMLKSPRLIRILLLEGDLEVVSVLVNKLNQWEQEEGLNLSLVVLSEYTMVEDYINSDTRHNYDVILLGHDCKAGGSFHTIFTKADPGKIISISSDLKWNEQARRKGVEKIVANYYMDMSSFSREAIKNIESLLGIKK